MYGWRGRIGIIVPSANAVAEPEFNRLVPDGVSVHASRMKVTGKISAASTEAMADDTERAADLLKQVADVIGWTCTGGSFFRGRAWEEALIERVRNATGKPAVTTAGSVVAALKFLGVRNVSVATPYPDEVNTWLQRFLREHGIETVKIKGLGVIEHGGANIHPPSTAFRLAKEVDDDRAEAIMISCTNFRTIEIIDYLERDLNKPVVTSNQATFWALLRLLGIRDRIEGHGSLLRKELRTVVAREKE